MTFCLNSIIIKPEEGTEIKNAIVLLHGYGGDGKDISMLTLNWKRHLPNTIFICPNAVSYTHLRPHETKANLVCRLLLEKKNN